jgi:hypothetical protein
VTSLGGGLFGYRTNPVTREPIPRSSSSFIRTRWLHLIYVFIFLVFVAVPLKTVAAPAAPRNAADASLKAAAAPAAPLKAAAAPVKAAAIDARCHACTAPDVDAPATEGLLVLRTNTLLPPRFFAPTNQFVGRWHGNACGGLPSRRAQLRSLSHSFAASQSNAPNIAGGAMKVPRRWRRRREARAVKPAVVSHRTETERQDALALADGWRSSPVLGRTPPCPHHSSLFHFKKFRFTLLRSLRGFLV